MPHSPNSADTLAWAYYHKGTYASARDLLQEATKQSPNDPSIAYHLGMVYSKLDDKANAAAAFNRALKLAPAPGTAEQIKKAMSAL
jgi:Flp pilus assembly protein TadD